MQFFKSIGEIFISLSVAIAGIFGFSGTPADLNVGATIPVNVAVFQTSLQASITSSATSMTLVSGTDKSGDSLSGYICFNIDEGTATEEFVCGTASGTAVSSMIRGIDPIDGDLEVTALKKAHRRGASVKVTNYPSLAIIARILNGDETFPNKISYTSHPTFTSNTELIDKKYADDLAIAGSPDASTTVKGIVEEATSSEINAGTAAGGTSARLFVNPSALAASNYSSMLPTFGEKSALPGDNTDIAVGSGNKYMTQTGFQKGAEAYAATATGNDTYAITLSPVPTSYVNGMRLRFKADVANTGAATLNVNSLGAVNLATGLSTALATGDILANQVVEVVYNSTGPVFEVINPASAVLVAPTFTNGTTTKNAADASTTQTIAHSLGKIPKYVRITTVPSSGTIGSPASVSTKGINRSFAVYNGTTQSSMSVSGDGTTVQVETDGFLITDTTIATGYQQGVITFDATNITITWTKNSNPTGTYTLLWEAEG